MLIFFLAYILLLLHLFFLVKKIQLVNLVENIPYIFVMLLYFLFYCSSI